MRFPCAFVVMFGMTTHSESLTGVQKELWHLINDEDARNILEVIIQKMNEAGDGTERIIQWRDEAQTFIPADAKYDEKYWVAAYVLHLSTTTKKTIQEFINIKQEISYLKYELSTLEDEIEEMEWEVKELENNLEHKEYQLSTIHYDMYYRDEVSEEETEELEEYEASEEDPEVLEIEIEQLKDALETMESNLGYLYYKRNDMWGRLGEMQYKREKLLEDLQEIAEQLVAS
jgi:chromosome segregation ATPase